MSPIAEFLDDLGGPKQAQPLRWQEDPRGERYGGAWVPDGPTVTVGVIKEDATEAARDAIRLGREVTDELYRVFADLDENNESPFKTDERLGLLGREMNVVSERPIEVEGIAIIGCAVVG